MVNPGKAYPFKCQLNRVLLHFSLLFRATEAFLLDDEGESVTGPVLAIGNTNSRYRFSLGAKEFMNQRSYAGPAHHCAIGIGHIASKIEKFGILAGLKVQKIC